MSLKCCLFLVKNFPILASIRSEDRTNEIHSVTSSRLWKLTLLCSVIAVPALVSGCSTSQTSENLVSGMNVGSVHSTSKNSYAYSGRPSNYTEKDRECLERAMFFESNRSSQDGLVAVGTVVMNRLESGRYPDSICGVVGQEKQFAPGVLSRPMKSSALPDVQKAAKDVLSGARHPKVPKNAMFFHTAGLTFPYKNMHYVLVAGGNAFYEKRSRMPKNSEAPQMVAESARGVTPVEPYAVAMAPEAPEPAAAAVATAAINNQAAPPVTLASASVPVPAIAEPAAGDMQMVAYRATDEQIDAIGRLLLTQNRPAN